MVSQHPTALVTGGRRGLGAAIARELAPTHQLILGGRSAESLEQIVGELGAAPWPVDLTDHAAVADAVADIDRLEVLCAQRRRRRTGNALGDVGRHVAEDLRGQCGRGGGTDPAVAARPAGRERARGTDQLGRGVTCQCGLGRLCRKQIRAACLRRCAAARGAGVARHVDPSGRIDTDMQRAIVASEGGEYDADAFLTPQTVARAVRNAVETPRDAHPTEIVLRPVPR